MSKISERSEDCDVTSGISMEATNHLDRCAGADVLSYIGGLGGAMEISSRWRCPSTADTSDAIVHNIEGSKSKFWANVHEEAYKVKTSSRCKAIVPSMETRTLSYCVENFAQIRFLACLSL